MDTTKRIGATLPAPTLAQRVAAMSDADLMFAARALATRPDGDAACTAVLEELERRIPAPAFEDFVSEIYA